MCIETESEREAVIHVLEIIKTPELLSDDCMCTTVASIQLHYTHNHAQ